METYDNLFVETDEVAVIEDYSLLQSTLQLGLEATYQVTFTPKNPIGNDGMLTLEWTDQVTFVEEEFKCSIETYKTFGNNCEVDFDAKMIKIKGVFSESGDPYQAPITINLDKITNPSKNKDLNSLVIKTFDDSEEKFPIDLLNFVPNTPCTFPCNRCSGDMDYCYSCWADEDSRFLMTTETFSTCKEKCDDSWTTDGNANSICQRCDSSCDTCLDNGEEGDRSQCVTCATGYDLRIGRRCVE